MRNFVIGMIIGTLLGGTLAWAATRVTLQSGNGAELGTTSNPLFIESI